MKKIKLLALLLVSVLSVNVWGANSGLTANPGEFILDFYNSEKISSTSGSDLTLANCTTHVTVPTGITASNVVTNATKTGTVQIDKNGGLTLGKGDNSNSYATFTIGASFPVRKVTIVATKWENISLYFNSTACSNAMNDKGTTYANCTKSQAVSLEPYSTSLKFANCNGSSNQKRVTLYTAVCEYGYRAYIVQGTTGTISAAPTTANENGAGWNTTEKAVVGLKENQSVTLSGLPANYAWKVTNKTSGADITASVLSGNILMMPKYDVNVTIESSAPAEPVTSLILSEAGTETDYKNGKNVGDKYTLPSSTEAVCGAKKLAGWSTVEITNPVENQPTSNFYALGAQVTLEANNKFYAVFADKEGDGEPNEYVKGTKDNLKDGSKLIVVNNTTKAMSNSASGTKLSPVTVTVSSNKITNPTSSIIWEISISNGKYILKNDGKYLRATANNNLVLSTTSDSWTIGTSNSKYTFTSACCSKQLEYYDNLFTVFNTGTSSAYLMDLYINNVSYSNYTTTCATPTYSVTIQSNNTTMGNVTVEPEITEDAYEAGTEFTVMAEPIDDQVYRFVGWTITPDNTGATLDDATSAIVSFTVGTGDVTLTANFEAKPTTPITVNFDGNGHGTPYSESLTEETAGNGVTLPTCTADKYYAFVGWSTSNSATSVEDNMKAGQTYITSTNNQTLYAVYARLYKVVLMDKNVEYVQLGVDDYIWDGEDYVALPDRTCKNEAYTFIGWSETNCSPETSTEPTLVTTDEGYLKPTKDMEIWPVFENTEGGTKWVKTTGGNVTEGVYALITTDGHAFNGQMNDDHLGLITNDAFAFDANGIATSAPKGTCELTFTAVSTGNYTMYNENNGYLYAKEKATKNLFWHNSESSSWAWKTTNWVYNGNSATLRSYNNSTFRTYSTPNGDVLLFAKKVIQAAYNSAPANDVTNPELDTPAGDYLSPLTVKITEASYDNDLIYYYTTDGTTPAADAELNPTGTSTMYDPEIGIVLQPANTYNLQVIGYDEDGYTSQIASATYGVWATYSTLAEMYAGFQEGKPVGLTLTDAYIHKVYTPGGTNKQLFVQEKNSTLGVVLSGQSADFAETIIAAAEGKTITFTVTGEYALGNGRQQIGKAKIASCTISEVAATRPTAENYTAASVANNLLGLTQLTEVYSMSKESNIVTVNTKEDGTGETYKVYNIFNVVKTLPETNIKCVVKGLFNIRDNEQYIMPVLDTDFDVVEKQDAQLPTVNPAGGASEGEAYPVANKEPITITRVAGFTTTYSVNDGTPVDFATAAQKTFNVTDENTKLVVTATRPYYNDASATYYYHIDPSLTKFPITLPSPQTYVKTETDLASAKAGDKVTITISQKVARYWETSVTVVKTDEESVTTDVTSEGEHVYSFTMPAYPVTVKVTAQDAPKSVIYYNKGGTGIEGEMSQESVYIGDEYTLKDCAFHRTGLTFIGWTAYKTGDESTMVTITDNKIIVPDFNVSVTANWDMAEYLKPGTWELVTNENQLEAGHVYVMAENTNAYTASNNISSGNNQYIMSTSETSTFSSDKNLITALSEGTAIFELGGTAGVWTLWNAEVEKYLTMVKPNTDINPAYADVDDTKWKITISNSNASLEYGSYPQIKFNTSGNRFKPYSSTSMLSIQLYRFYPKARKAFFYANAGDDEVTNMPEMQRADPTTNIVHIPNITPERTGYTFTEWNSAQGGSGIRNAQPNDNLELWQDTSRLYAQWIINQYNITVEPVDYVSIKATTNGGEDITEGNNANVNFKKSVVLSYSDLNEDYVFKSWKVTKADDETIVIPISIGSSTTFEVPAYDVKVSAVIEDKASAMMTVTYHANGGKNKTQGEPEAIETSVNYNTVLHFTADNCPFEKELCVFDGWNTKADGSGTTYKTQHTVKSDINLYAMWKAIGVQYTIATTSSVNVTRGAVPESSIATFENTYTNAATQLTGGNSMTLTLSGYDGKVITGISLSTKSNSSAGAGTYEVKIGERTIFTATGTYNSIWGHWWNSSFETQELSIDPIMVQNEENIVIKISATTSSLHCQSFTIYYTDSEILRDELETEHYTTFCWPKTIPAGCYTGATFWNIENKTTMADGRLSSITIVQHEGDLEAGVPYIMYNTASEFKCYQTGEAVDAPEGNNGLVGVFEDTPFSNFDGDAATVDAAAAARGYYVISNGILYLCGNNCGVYANYAYIVNEYITDQSANTPPTAPRRVIGRPNGTPTTLNGLNGNQAGKAQKALIDGHIYILRDNKMYNAQGQLVK